MSEVQKILIATAGTLPQGERDDYWRKVLEKRESELYDLLMENMQEYPVDAEYKYRSEDGVHQFVAKSEQAIPVSAINELFGREKH